MRAPIQTCSSWPAPTPAQCMASSAWARVCSISSSLESYIDASERGEFLPASIGSRHWILDTSRTVVRVFGRSVLRQRALHLCLSSRFALVEGSKLEEAWGVKRQTVDAARERGELFSLWVK